MVELKSFPFDSITDDREYPAQIFRNYFHKFLSTGIYFGKYKNYGDYSMKVVPQEGLKIQVTKGAGILRGLDFELEEDTTLTVNLSLNKTRRDMVVVKSDDTLAERKTTLYVKEGTETEFAELERTNDIFEICLAKINVGDTKATIDLDDIEDTRRDSELAGIVTSLIDIDIQDVLDDITKKKDKFFESLGITTKKQAEELIEELSQYVDVKRIQASDFVSRLESMLQELQKDMVPSELVSIDNQNFASKTLDKALTEVSTKLNDTIEQVNTSLEGTTQEVETKINTIKQETEARAFTIETNSWEQKVELYEAVIADERVKENDLADVAFDSSTYSIAEEAGVKSYVTEETGKIRLFADSVPSGILSGKYTLSKGGGEVSGEN